MSNLEEKCYVGIDVAKAKLDVFILSSNEHFTIDNNGRGIENLVEKIMKLGARETIHVAMESTGGYEQLAASLLSKEGLKVSILNSRQVRDFAKSMNKLAKTDKIDARIIAQYARVVMPRETLQNRVEIKKITQLENRRRQLLEAIRAEKNRLDKNCEYAKDSIKRMIEHIRKELKEIDAELEKAVNEDKICAEKRAILMSVKGIGKITAHALIAHLPELGHMSGKQITALCGLAPFNRDSGTLRGKRTVWGGRKIVRVSLYMATLVAIKYNAYIGAFYKKLIAQRKAKMTAVTAAMHKLLLILNAMMKSGSCWDEEKEKKYLEAMNKEIGVSLKV